jgi:outer membrane biosynthesis protein TonB
MRLHDPLFNPLIPRAYFGGGAPKVEPVKVPKVQPIQIPEPPPQPKIEMPAPLTAEQIKAMMPEPVKAEPIPPPPTTSPLEAQQVADEQVRRQNRRQGYAASIIAGEQQAPYTNVATGTGSLLG